MKYFKLSLLVILIFTKSALSQTYYHKEINENKSKWVMATPNSNGIVLIGIDFNDFYTTYLQLDNEADTVWTKRYDSLAQVSLVKSVAYWGVDNQANHISWAGSKLNLWESQKLNFLRGKSYDMDTTIFNPSKSSISLVKELNDNKKAIVGFTNVEIIVDGIISLDGAPSITIVDSDLNISWTRFYYIEGLYFKPKDIIERNDRYILLGNCITYDLPNSTNKIGAIVVDKSTGNLLSPYAQVFDHNGMEYIMNSVSEDGYYVSGNQFDFINFNPTSGFVSKISESGIPLLEWTKSIQVEDFPLSKLNFTLKSSGELFLAGVAGKLNQFGGWDDGSFFVTSVDTNLTNFLWGTVFSDTLIDGKLEHSGASMLLKDLGGSILVGGSSTIFDDINYFMNIDKNNGLSSCRNIPVNVKSQNEHLNVTTFPVSDSLTVLSNPQPYVLPDDTVVETILGQSTIICQGTLTSIHRINEPNSWTIYPNPSNGIFHVSFENEIQSECIITVYNILGKTVYYSVIKDNAFSFNLSHLSEGLYYYNIRRGKEIFNGSIIIQH